MHIPAYITVTNDSLDDDSVNSEILSPSQDRSCRECRWEQRRPARRQNSMPSCPRRRGSLKGALEDLDEPVRATLLSRSKSCRTQQTMPPSAPRRRKSITLDLEEDSDAESANFVAPQHQHRLNNDEEAELNSAILQLLSTASRSSAKTDILPHVPRRRQSFRRVDTTSPSRCFAHAA
ncbi:expressed unknown protein [Seminavis robusta]|uniref:Uncharacterized protein n=1 Tax=Seminavis robusta TaxID=568900 RepID=A0A9N8DZ34_9STRA|nr:expressed unknown protein [Seminavis robusta]|eukprot:Sro405_g136030.1 n/a (178) ;mRNA; f:7860-8393